MTIFIEVCHPNDFDKKQWTRVDECSSPAEVVDALASPVFEIYEGLLVRTHDNVYCGVCDGTSFVDLSESSKIMKSRWTKNKYRMTEYFGKNFVQMANDPRHFEWYLGAIRELVPANRQVAAYLRCFGKVEVETRAALNRWSPITADQEYREYLRLLSRYVIDEAKRDEVEEAVRVRSEMRFNGHTFSHVNVFFVKLGKFALSNPASYEGAEGVGQLLYCLPGPVMSINPLLRIFKRVLKEEIPFYDIAIGLSRIR